MTSQSPPPCTCQGRPFLILSCPAHNPLSGQYYPTVSGSASLYLPSGHPGPSAAAASGVITADQPFVGFRAWQHTVTQKLYRLTPFSPVRYVPDHVELRSTGVGASIVSPWNDPIAEARCRYFPDPSVAVHPSPSRDCECGLYTWKTPLQAADGPRGATWGAVLIWGRVVEHDEGFRSQHARIICLADNGHEVTEYVARQRGIRVVPANRLAVYAGEFGKVFSP